MNTDDFRSKMNEFKKARESNPLLSYWLWKSNRYADGTDYVEDTYLPEVVVTPKGNYINQPFDRDAYNSAMLSSWGKLTRIGPEDVIDYLPIVGDIIGAYDIAKDFYNKDYIAGGVGLGLSILPNVIEKPLRRFGRKIRNMFRKTDDNLDYTINHDRIPDDVLDNMHAGEADAYEDMRSFRQTINQNNRLLQDLNNMSDDDLFSSELTRRLSYADMYTLPGDLLSPRVYRAFRDLRSTALTSPHDAYNAIESRRAVRRLEITRNYNQQAEDFTGLADRFVNQMDQRINRIQSTDDPEQLQRLTDLYENEFSQIRRLYPEYPRYADFRLIRRNVSDALIDAQNARNSISNAARLQRNSILSRNPQEQLPNVDASKPESTLITNSNNNNGYPRSANSLYTRTEPYDKNNLPEFFNEDQEMPYDITTAAYFGMSPRQAVLKAQRDFDRLKHGLAWHLTHDGATSTDSYPLLISMFLLHKNDGKIGLIKNTDGSIATQELNHLGNISGEKALARINKKLEQLSRELNVSDLKAYQKNGTIIVPSIYYRKYKDGTDYYGIRPNIDIDAIINPYQLI